MKSREQFRAVIVGGGPVGLTAAHSFALAGIDFIVLEARDTCAPDAGASIVLNPASLRIFHQLGLEDQARRASAEHERALLVSYGGKTRKDVRPFTAFDQSLGQRPMTFHRQDVLKILYDNLPQEVRAKVLVNKKVVNIETRPDGVQVTCADGSTFEGSIVVGADGVYSKTRGFMRKLALDASPNTAVNPEKPYTAYYKCMWGTVPIPPGLSPGDHLDCHSDMGISSMFLTGRDRGWFFLFGLLDKPTQERMDYTESDQEAYAEQLADLHIGPGLKFRDIWSTRYSAGMSNLDEGVLDHWSWNRIVLMGDAVHKVTPNAGWGLNSGIQDVAVLTNGLRRLLLDSSGAPKVEALEQVFQAYQEARRENMQQVFDFSATQTRQSARDGSWKGWIHWVVESITGLIPHFDWFMIRYKGSKLVSAGYALDFLGGWEPFSGVVPWAHPIRPLKG
ncbi:hypothetical protein ACO1O0_008785 [Amphichorda felina]